MFTTNNSWIIYYPPLPLNTNSEASSLHTFAFEMNSCALKSVHQGRNQSRPQPDRRSLFTVSFNFTSFVIMSKILHGNQLTSKSSMASHCFTSVSSNDYISLKQKRILNKYKCFSFVDVFNSSQWILLRILYMEMYRGWKIIFWCTVETLESNSFLLMRSWLGLHLIWREMCRHRLRIIKRALWPHWGEVCKDVLMQPLRQKSYWGVFMLRKQPLQKIWAVLQDLAWTSSKNSQAWECGLTHCADTTFHLGSSYATSLIFLSGTILFSAAALI